MTTDILEFPALKEAKGKLTAKQDELGKIFAEAGPDIDMAKVTSIDGDSKAKTEHIANLNAEMSDLGKEIEKLTTVARAAKAARDRDAEREAKGEAGDGHAPPPSTPAEQKSLGDLFVESNAYKGRRSGGDGPSALIDGEVKTLMTTAAGWTPETTRTGRVVDFATRPIQVTDIVPTTTTSQAAVTYMEETTFTNNAAEVAEGGTYGEAALVLTERSVTIRKIGVWLPVTDEQLEDEVMARGYINNRLPFMARQRLDGQLLVGNGTPPNIAGFLNTAGIQTQAKGADPTPDAVYKAMTKVRVTGRAFPNAVVFHPNDWQDVRLLRTADGIYIWGNPSDAGPERIWGLGVVQSDAETENTALVGDFANFSELAIRRGMDVQVSNSHSTFFVEGKQAIRADIRAALVVYRPAAFCTVTGI